MHARLQTPGVAISAPARSFGARSSGLHGKATLLASGNLGLARSVDLSARVCRRRTHVVCSGSTATTASVETLTPDVRDKDCLEATCSWGSLGSLESCVQLAQQVEAQRRGLEEKPGSADRRHFKLHSSVDFWTNYRPDVPGTRRPGPVNTMSDLVTGLASGVDKSGMFSSPLAAAYWAYHLARTGFLTLQGLTGLLATLATAGAEGNVAAAGETKLGQLWKLRMFDSSESALTPFVEPFVMYHQDLKNIEAGLYKLPWDMTTPGNKQYDPVHVMRIAVAFASEASNTLQRRMRGSPDRVWLDSPMYPEYYLNTFHYQTDGWFSEKSASVYETATETLFLGRQDAMQRQSLVPLHNYMQTRARGRNTKGEDIKMLEVACGTGRFATFVKDNYPQLEYTALDLSPYYLYEARKNMKQWHKLRQPNLSMGGVDGSGAHFLQAAAEKIPQPDASQDVVLCVFLFHELPPEVRRAASREMARVLKPGGLLILTDSIQLGDRLPLDEGLGKFFDFNEPFYKTYIAEDLGKMLSDCGLECDEKLLASSSKVLSFRKPM